MWNKLDTFTYIVGTIVISSIALMIAFYLGILVREGIEFRKECIKYSSKTGQCLEYDIQYKDYIGKIYLKGK